MHSESESGDLEEQIRSEVGRVRARRVRLRDAISRAEREQKDRRPVELREPHLVPRDAPRLPGRVLAMFTYQLSLMMSSGIHIVQALESLGSIDKKALHRVATLLAEDISKGRPLSDAMSTMPGCFSRVYLCLVRAAETSGSLVEVLADLSSSLERGQRLRDRVWQQLIYPGFVLAVSIVMTSILLYYMLPRLIPAYSQTGAELPALTRLLMLAANHPELSLGLPLALLALGAFLSVSNSRPARAFRARFEVPLVSQMQRQVGIALVCRNLALLSKRGVPMGIGLTSLMGTTTCPEIDLALEHALDRLEEGCSLSQSLELEDVFPPMVIGMIAVGEQSGRMEHLLLRCSAVIEDQVEMYVTMLVQLVEVSLLLGLGLLVGIIMLGLFMPLYNLASLPI